MKTYSDLACGWSHVPGQRPLEGRQSGSPGIPRAEHTFFCYCWEQFSALARPRPVSCWSCENRSLSSHRDVEVWQGKALRVPTSTLQAQLYLLPRVHCRTRRNSPRLGCCDSHEEGHVEVSRAPVRRVPVTRVKGRYAFVDRCPCAALFFTQ